METKSMIFYGIIVLIIIASIVLIWVSRKKDPFEMIKKHTYDDDLRIKRAQRTHTKIVNTNKFPNLDQQLSKLSHELRAFLNKKAGNVDAAFSYCLRYDPKTIKNNLEGNTPDNMVKDFTLDGQNIKEPVMRMYKVNPQLFAQLGASGLLEFLGKIVAMTAWAVNAKNKSENDFKAFTQCLESVQWTSPNVWNSIDDPKGEVMQCIR